MEQVIILQGITVDQLLTRVDEIIESKVKRIIHQTEEPNKIRYMTRKEVASFLTITLPTLNDWTSTSTTWCNQIFYLFC